MFDCFGDRRGPARTARASRGGLGFERRLGESSAAGAGVAAASLVGFVEKDWNGGEGGDRVEPWGVEDGVEREAGERDEGQVGAGGGLDGVGGEGNVACEAGVAALERGEDGHGDQGGQGDRDAEAAGARMVVLKERDKGDDRDDGGQGVEENGGGAGGDSLGYAACGEELEQDHGCGEEFDEAVGGEGEQGGAVRSEGGAGRDSELDEHP
jgi:hypothetical protein